MIDKQTLEELYNSYNDRRHVHPDPLEFLYDYEEIKEREIAGLVAASLAYGQVKQILKSVSAVLSVLGKKPSEYLANAGPDRLIRDFERFKHRFTTSEELIGFLNNTGVVIQKYGSLKQCFYGLYNKEENILQALKGFSSELRLGDCLCYSSLVPMPEGSCAFKRMNLYLRWMVRKDNVDPGGWDNIPMSKLVVPVDIHMHRISLEHGFTSRKQADIKTALEITESFKKYCPEDPVKYDFSLTRAGIHAGNRK